MQLKAIHNSTCRSHVPGNPCFLSCFWYSCSFFCLLKNFADWSVVVNLSHLVCSSICLLSGHSLLSASRLLSHPFLNGVPIWDHLSPHSAMPSDHSIIIHSACWRIWLSWGGVGRGLWRWHVGGRGRGGLWRWYVGGRGGGLWWWHVGGRWQRGEEGWWQWGWQQGGREPTTICLFLNWLLLARI